MTTAYQDGLSASGTCRQGATTSTATVGGDFEKKRKTDLNSSPLSHTLSSQLASSTSTLLFYPFDMLRVRFMSQDGTIQRQHNGQTYHSIRKAFATIYHEEGPRALFRGCHVAVLGSAAAWGVYMYTYRSLCCSGDVCSFLGRAGVSFLASLLSTALTSPIWLIKTRMQIEDATKSRNYVTFGSGFRHVLRTTGFCSLWRGLSLQMTLILPNALNYPMYDFFKGMMLQARSQSTVKGGELSVSETLVCSTLTKLLFVLLSHPIMFLKVRLQDQRWNMGEVKYTNVRHSLLLILKREGIHGMFRGLNSSLIHSFPRGVTHYLLYEKALGVINAYV
ncbi:mitochondrial carrier protein [Trypanosoma rangeli]|uniref:Mitochondrial carrier protein n=1 Tax=Trypanosoma rangeli TaxID=5698 RepID=A0A3R7P246_TRYRA|nr:mitochondrial carrier protein [Trypanosoma rangeli]RNF11537.1 mitochondrial carrier protein [Trypanosoma rangeli]|eukprot:RNF11537.1 mitochondrial carrier protein [Trypanosoma rangeli]